MGCDGDSFPAQPNCADSASRVCNTATGSSHCAFDARLASLESGSTAPVEDAGSTVDVVDAIRAHGGSGGPVTLTFVLVMTIERFEPEFTGESTPRGVASGAGWINVEGFGGAGMGGLTSGRPGHQVETDSVHVTLPIVPEGPVLVVHWNASSQAAGGGWASAHGMWHVEVSDPAVTIEHCRAEATVPARSTSWGQLKAIYRGGS
jgi:hypothetical protein